MSEASHDTPPPGLPGPPNGAGAAAILAAGTGSLALGVLALAGDAWPVLRARLVLWPPTGPLSGVSTGAVVVWLAAWIVLARRWSGREVSLGLVNIIAFGMLIASLLLTFPPFMDLLQGR